MIDLIKTELKVRGKDSYSVEEIVEIIERYTKTKETKVESCGFVADMESREIIVGDKKYNLPKKEFLIVHYLMENKNKVINRERILNKVWEQDVVVIDRTIDVHIRRIRNKFPTIPITTIKGVGYTWKEFL
jgi:two-component system alkaline phosphatase synthesis response regulator PhoP